MTQKFLEVNYISQLVNLLTTFIPQTEDCSDTADMIQQVGAMMSLLERSLHKLRLKMTESRASDQMCSGTLEESGYVDCYYQDYDQRGVSFVSC